MKHVFVLAAITALILSACAGETSTFSTEAVVTSTGTTIVSPPVAYPGKTASSPQASQPGCTVKTDQTKPNPTVESLLPAVTEEDWSSGRSDALATILEYGDFQ